MTSGTRVRIRDPELYRVLVFLARSGREDPVESRTRLDRLWELHEKLGWMPAEADVALREPSVLDQNYLMLARDPCWRSVSEMPKESPPADAEILLANAAVSDGVWKARRYVQSYHEVALTMLGVTRQGVPNRDDAEWWLAAKTIWHAAYTSEEEWRPLVALPDVKEAPERPRLVGELWLWLGEWDEPPVNGWDKFATDAYQRNDGYEYLVLPWGLVGLCDKSDSDIPTITVHCARRDAGERSRFVFDDLRVVIAEYVKATQLLWLRHKLHRQPALHVMDREIDSAIERFAPVVDDRLDQAERTMMANATRVLRLSKELADFENDVAALGIASDAVTHRLAEAAHLSEMKPLPALTRRLDLLYRQLASDLSYYRAAEARVKSMLDALGTLVEIERARVDRQLANAGLKQALAANRLAVIAIFLGSFVGLGQLIDSDLKLVGIRLAVSLGGAVFSTLIYIFWFATVKTSQDMSSITMAGNKRNSR